MAHGDDAHERAERASPLRGGDWLAERKRRAGRKRRGHGPVSGAAMAAAARGCPPAGSGDRALAELLLEFSRTQYRAKDGGGAAAKVRRPALGV